MDRNRTVAGLDVHKDSIYLCIMGHDEAIIFEKTYGVLTPELRQMCNDMLDRDENIVLALTISMGHVSNEVLRHSLDLHPTDITKVLRGLCDRGMLLSSGFGRGTTYEIAKDFVRNCQPKVKEKTGFTPQEPLGGLFAFSNDAEVVTTANIETSAEANAKANAKASAGAPRDKELIIRELTKYCKVWRKSSEMARYVGKSPNYISGRIVPEMLRRDLIEREYPDNPKDSRQRYRVKRKTN